MAINLKPIDVLGFSIARSVGLRGANDEDDIFTIKTLLNGIAAERGGADGTLDMNDLSNSPAAMEPLIDAIILFQGVQPGLQRDGRVDPEKNTIKRMRELFKKRRGGEVGVNVKVQPDGPIFGPCDALGFSAARLKLVGDEWSAFDPFGTVRQMVPLGKTRRLRVTGRAGTAFKVSMASPHAAIVDQTPNTFTLMGQAPGEADLIVNVEGESPVVVRILVRRPSSPIPIDVVHLGAAANANGIALNTQQTVVTTVSRVFENQANVTFVAGQVRIATSVRTDGREVPIDSGKRLSIRVTSGPPQSSQEFRFSDLQSLAINKRAVTMFVSNQIVDDEGPGVAGRGSFDERMLWINPGTALGSNAFTLPAHEIGHSLGMNHVTVSFNSGFLMNPTLQANNFIIPCETLEELKP